DAGRGSRIRGSVRIDCVAHIIQPVRKECMMRVRRTTLVLLASVVFLVCAGCVSSRVHTSVPAFANAVNLTATNTESAFQTVEQKYAEVQAMSLVVDYGRKPFRPDDIHDWLAPEDLEVRMKLFEALKQYATQLA